MKTNGMNMQRSKTRHAASSCILMLMCVRHGITHMDKYINGFHSVYSSELYLPDDYTPSILDTDSSEEYRTDEMGWGNTAKSVQWPPDDVRHTHEDSKENLKSFGGIYDYLITDQNVWHGGGGGNTKPNSNGETFRAIDQDSSEWDKGASERERDSWETDDDSSEKDKDSSEGDGDSSAEDSSETDDDSSEKDKDSSEGDGDSSAEDSSETAEDSSERGEDSSEGNVNSSAGGKCEIQYFYDIDVKSAKCRMEKEGCHLEYSGFRTVIPDLKRCLVENNRCILQKGAKRVMLPFTRIGCKKYRQNPRMSNEPIHDVNNETQENSCEFHYMDELAFDELACELKEGECFLSDGNRMTIILDEENCRLENGTCVASQDFKTDLPFVGKDCREFDPAPKIRRRRQIQTYPGYDCQLQRFQNLGFYTDVNCALWGGECFLELDNMITVAPDGENCFLYGGRCYVSTPFTITNIPLVDKACMVLDEFTERYTDVQTGQMNEFYVYPLMRTIYDDTSMMYGRAAYDFPDENGIPRVQNEGQPSEPSRNDLSEQQPRAARKGASKGDIFTNSNYTTCVLLVRKKKDKVEKRCYPGNDNTVQYDRGKNCRMIQGHCFRVRKDPEFLKEYFSTPHNNILTCVMLGKECYMLDGDMLLYKKEECHEPVCRALVADPVNPGAYCDFIDCGDSDDSDDPEDSEHAGQIGGEVPVTVLDNDMAEGLSDGLKQLLPKNHTTGKPVGIFYSMSFIYNNSLSAVYTSPNSSDQSAGSSSGDGGNNGQNFDKNDSGDKNLPEVEEVDEEEETEDITDEIDDYDYDEDYDLPSSRKSVKKDPVASDIWRDAKFTDCIFHMTMRKKRWETKCYPGNQNTDEISPQDAHNCRLIDGECYKVHRDRKFLSSYFKKPPNRMLKCVIVEDDCYLKDKNLLLFNSDDCYESICGQLRSDGKVPGNFCDSSKCGHSKPNLVSFKEVKGARRSPLSKSTTSLGNIEDHMVAPLLKTLKAVVPQTDFEGDPSSVVYSIGLLYNDPDSSPVTVRKVSEVLSRRKNDTIERGSQSLPEGRDVTNSTDQKDSEISRRNNGTTESESLISFTEQEANGSEISNSTENVINGNSNEQIVISPDGLGRSAKTESSDGKYQSIDSKESLPNPAR
ncbi:uncharacterized protein LOC123308717 [Coccinella septempunctata]|uniref:uncharacterized protein LOC123308717 n=1 Tax=Coccinella septempunctata TaxID=41139 RepID=UPI001D08D340|nr:uncharacterized protein LOC123308717 [Coccinella septempunctata]